MKIKIEMKGIQTAVAALKNMGNRGKTALRKVVRAGAAEATKRAKQALRPRRDTGTLEKSVGLKVKIYRNSQFIVAIVGPRRKFIFMSKKGKKWASRYAHFVHNGTKRKAATPFLKQAVEGHAQEIENVMAKKLASELEKFK